MENVWLIPACFDLKADATFKVANDISVLSARNEDCSSFKSCRTLDRASSNSCLFCGSYLSRVSMVIVVKCWQLMNLMIRDVVFSRGRNQRLIRFPLAIHVFFVLDPELRWWIAHGPFAGLDYARSSPAVLALVRQCPERNRSI